MRCSQSITQTRMHLFTNVRTRLWICMFTFTDCFTLTGPDSDVECPKCARNEDGELTCCAKGGSWRGICGADKINFEHTWTEGITACSPTTKSTTPKPTTPSRTTTAKSATLERGNIFVRTNCSSLKKDFNMTFW